MRTADISEINSHFVLKEHSIDFSKFNREPKEWGENVTGVKNCFLTDRKEIALELLKKGLDIELIIEATKLSIDEIEQLKKR